MRVLIGIIAFILPETNTTLRVCTFLNLPGKIWTKISMIVVTSTFHK